jgi:hypothetical protein
MLAVTFMAIIFPTICRAITGRRLRERRDSNEIYADRSAARGEKTADS